MIAETLDYRHLADEERYPVWIGRSAIANLNARLFPVEPADAPPNLADTMTPLRRAVYELIVAAGGGGITGPELHGALGWPRQQLHTQLQALRRTRAVRAVPEPGQRGTCNRYWA